MLMFAGVGLAFSAMPNLIVQAVPPTQTGEAIGFNALVRSVGASLGTQISAAALAGSAVAGSPLPTDSGYSDAFLLGGAVALLAGVVALAIPAPHGPGPRRRRSGRTAAGIRGAAVMEALALPKRADALRNRKRVVEAAGAVFAERGIEATVPEVARAPASARRPCTARSRRRSTWSPPWRSSAWRSSSAARGAARRAGRGGRCRRSSATLPSAIAATAR